MQISGKWGDMYSPKAESLCMRMLWRRGGFRAEVWGVSRKVGEKKTAQCVCKVLCSCNGFTRACKVICRR